jgi:ketosteroid isomerase-like protein
MKNQKHAITVSLGALVLVGGMIAWAIGIGQGADARPVADESAAGEIQAVERVNDRFYAALNAMLEGDPKPFEELWWHTDDVVFMGADGGYCVGWDETYGSWKRMAAIKIGGKVEPADAKITAGPKIAVAHNYVTGTNLVGGVREEIKVRVTSVFRKERDVWKMTGHHVDLRPPVRDQLKKKASE